MSNKDNSGDKTWPLPKFRFEVDLGSKLQNIAFQEVSGMETKTQTIEYRKTNSTHMNTMQMPGIAKYGNVTMKRGVFINDSAFWDLMNDIEMNTIKRRTVLIKLLNEKGAVTMSWELKNAWPTKIVGTDLKSNGSEIAVDMLEIAHEELTVKNSS